MQPMMTFKLTRYRDWEREIEDAIGKFIRWYDIAPNVLMLNDVTYNRLNIAFAMGLVEHDTYEGPPRIGCLDWGDLGCGNIETQLANDETLAERELRLVFRDSGRAGEPVPIVQKVTGG